MHFAVRPQRPGAVGDTITDLEARHLGPHRLDHPRPFGTEAGRQRRRIQPAAVIGIDEIQANGLVTHNHRLRPRSLRLEIDIFKNLGSSDSAELDTLCHVLSP